MAIARYLAREFGMDNSLFLVDVFTLSFTGYIAHMNQVFYVTDKDIVHCFAHSGNVLLL